MIFLLKCLLFRSQCHIYLTIILGIIRKVFAMAIVILLLGVIHDEIWGEVADKGVPVADVQGHQHHLQEVQVHDVAHPPSQA